MAVESRRHSRSMWKSYFEFQLKLLPFALLVLGWGVRVETFMRAGPRFTSADAQVLRMEQVIQHQQLKDEVLASVPPAWFRRDVEELQEQVQELNRKIDRLLVEGSG